MRFLTGSYLRSPMFFIFLFVCSIHAAWAQEGMMLETDGTVDSTAIGLLLRDEPLTDLYSPEAEDQIFKITDELQMMFDLLFTSRGQASYLDGVSSLSLNSLYFSIDTSIEGAAEVMEALNLRFANAVWGINLEDGPIGHADLDDLNTRFNVTRYREPVMQGETLATYRIRYEDRQSPHVVAQAYEALPYVTSAGVTPVSSVRKNARKIERFSSDPMIYKLYFGWGECFDTCTHHRRFYVELGEDEDGFQQALLIGSLGEDIPLDLKKPNFKGE